MGWITGVLSHQLGICCSYRVKGTCTASDLPALDPDSRNCVGLVLGICQWHLFSGFLAGVRAAGLACFSVSLWRLQLL